MKIGYIYNLNAYPPRGGNHVHVLELVQGFLKVGHQVAVLDDPTMPDVINYHGGEPESVQAFIDDIDVLYIRIDARFLRQLPLIEVCMNLSGGKPVVWEINAPANETLAFSWLGGKVWGVEELFIKRLKRKLHAFRKLPGIKKEERFRRSLAKRVNASICVSEALKRYAVEELGISKSIVLPNGGPLISRDDIENRRKHRNSDVFTVFYSGSAIYPWQGLNMLSEVIRLAREKAPDMRFVLAVNQNTEFLPKGDNVEIRQGLDREGIINSICASHVCVALHPDYPWSPYGFHNSPMKLFEYMACMTPVVTSNRAQMAELISHGENGLLCGDTADDILNKLIALRDDQCLAEKLGESGWRFIQNERSWNENVLRTIEVFEKELSC